MHTTATSLDAIRKYSDDIGSTIIRLFLQERSKTTRVIWTVWSHSQIRPHGWWWGGSRCSVSQTFFKCESQCLWYEIYRPGKGTREPSLPAFDKETGKYPNFISRGNMITCLQLPSCAYWHFCFLSHQPESESRKPFNGRIKWPYHVSHLEN